MKCPSCSSDNRDGVNFCEECGVKFETICPKCKTAISYGKKFCGEFGQILKAQQDYPFIDYTPPKSYTPKFLADKIFYKRSALEGERKFVTVLFADVTNYTSMAEKLDSEEVHQIMDGCFLTIILAG